MEDKKRNHIYWLETQDESHLFIDRVKIATLYIEQDDPDDEDWGWMVFNFGYFPDTDEMADYGYFSNREEGKKHLTEWALDRVNTLENWKSWLWDRAIESFVEINPFIQKEQLEKAMLSHAKRIIEREIYDEKDDMPF